MKGKQLLSVFAVILAAAVYAEDPPKAPKNNKSSVAVVGYQHASQQMDTLFLTPTNEYSYGVRLDYKPFESYGFNLSAASVSNQYNSASLSTLQRAYVGLGWQKLLDDSQHLGVRVDIGAIFDDNDPMNASGEQVPTEQTSIPDNTWHPVISLGVTYKF